MGQLKAVNESGVVNRWMRAHLCLTGLSLFFPPSYFILLAMRPIDDTLVAMSPRHDLSDINRFITVYTQTRIA